MKTIFLKPTHSAYAQAEDIPEALRTIPIRLMAHQVETYRAVQEHRADVIWHTGMTGDGKSLAGLLSPIVHSNQAALAMYPTNELIADQQRKLESHLKEWNIRRLVLSLNARTLDEQMDRQDVDRSNALDKFLKRPDILLTNPDIFHYIVTGRYVKQGFQPLDTLNRLMFRFKQIIVDEFHLMDQAQATALLTAMVFMRYVNKDRPPVFILQSATPDETFKEALTRAGLSIHEIKGDYIHEREADPGNYREILRGVELSFTSDTIPDWLEKHGAPLGAALEDGKGRGAALFTGVFSALESVPVAKAALPMLNIKTNTGLTPPSEKAESRHADLLIGTATVDTGVDLEINRLVFEAYDAANFKQRLGRLGRHKGYTDQQKTLHEFADFAAVASVPAWISAAIEERAADEMARNEFFDLVEDAYGKRHGTIYAYNRLWGWLLAYDLVYRLGAPVIREQYADVKPDIVRGLGSALQFRFDHDHKELHDQFQKDPHHRRLKNEAFTFRGSSAFTAMLVNDSYSGAERYQFYDLISVLGRGDVSVLDFDTAKRQAVDAGVPKETFQRENPVIALQWHGVGTEKRRITVELTREAWQVAEQRGITAPLVTTGLMIRTEPQFPLGEPARKTIENRTVAARVCMNHVPSELHRRLKLGTFFPLHHFANHRGETGAIALGREALLLDAAVSSLRADDPGALVC